jgi:crotonobetainyl-CoA:carnitine CoA-transferase CaiB-like acyl-CoA transferase
MIASNAWGYSDDFCTYAGKPPVPLCDDDYMGIHALERVYPAAGGSWVQLAVRTDHELSSLLAAVGRSDLLDDPRFADAEARAANDGALVKELSVVFAARPAAEWEADLSAVDVGCVSCDLKGQPVFTSFDPGLREAGLTRTYEHPIYGEMVRTAPPLAFSEGSSRFEPPCLRGQHNHEVLTELGYSASEIAELEDSGSVIAFKPA